jgi:hypothetical protein
MFFVFSSILLVFIHYGCKVNENIRQTLKKGTKRQLMVFERITLSFDLRQIIVLFAQTVSKKPL